VWRSTDKCSPPHIDGAVPPTMQGGSGRPTYRHLSAWIGCGPARAALLPLKRTGGRGCQRVVSLVGRDVAPHGWRCYPRNCGGATRVLQSRRTRQGCWQRAPEGPARWSGSRRRCVTEPRLLTATLLTHRGGLPRQDRRAGRPSTSTGDQRAGAALYEVGTVLSSFSVGCHYGS